MVVLAMLESNPQKCCLQNKPGSAALGHHAIARGWGMSTRMRGGCSAHDTLLPLCKSKAEALAAHLSRRVDGQYKSSAWFCFQLAPNTHEHPCPEGWPHKGSSCLLGRGGEGRSRSCLLWQGWLAEGKPHQREGISPYPAGMHFHFHLLPGHSSSGAFHHLNPGHHEVREMLPDHFRGMPPASNYCLLEVTFYFEECMKSIRKGRARALP